MFGIPREIVETLRASYPAGSRVQLDIMYDEQAPDIGTLGTVRYVDDIGTIHIAWDTGSSLGVVYPCDKCHIVGGEV